MARGASRCCGRRRCSASICRRSFTASRSALHSTSFATSVARCCAGRLRLRRASVIVEELIATVGRYLGEERTRTAFKKFAAARRIGLDPHSEADIRLLQYGEYLLASAIG